MQIKITTRNLPLWMSTHLKLQIWSRRIPLNTAAGKGDQPSQMMGHHAAQLDSSIPSEAKILCPGTLCQRNPSSGARGSMHGDVHHGVIYGGSELEALKCPLSAEHRKKVMHVFSGMLCIKEKNI